MAKIEIEDTELADLKKAAAAGARSAALADALRGELDTAKAGLGKLKDLEAQVATLAAEKLDAVYSGAGITDAKIRRVFDLEFEELSAAEGGPKDLGKWLGELKADPTKAPAHLSPFLSQAKAPAGGAGGGQRSPLPNGNRGAAGGVDASTDTFSAEQIEKMTPQELQAVMPTLVQQHPELAALASAFAPPASGTH